MFDPARLRARFRELCELPSPSGSERRVADRVAMELRQAGIEVAEDDTAAATGAGCGNLLARLPGRSGASGLWLAFCAHLDTVPCQDPIEVVDQGDRFRSAGDTILGADNKAAVSVLVELIRGWAEAGAGGGDLLTEAGPPCGIELLLTASEENGLNGAREFDLTRLRSSRGYVIDHASPVGEILTASPSHIRFRADFTGLEAHAGIRPEAGRSAIAAAAVAISDLPQGRLDPETTANLGRIEGGSSGNVVPAECRVEGEVRSLDPDRAHQVMAEISGICADRATAAGCDVAITSETVFDAHRLAWDHPLVEMAARAFRRCGIEPVEATTGGGSDANALARKGFECVLLADGTRDNHTAQESIDGADLDRMLAVCDTLLELQAESSHGAGAA